jgi:uncharacterized protein (DUF2235 family)
MKRIALFCDGTWNDETDPNPTNVYLLSRSIAQRDDAGIEQLAEYFSGVGTEENTRIRGGAWGMGLDRRVVQIYRRLCEVYDVGDEIYVFGFSRGAYTARSLCGLMRTAGIVGREHLAQVDEAMRVYRRRETGGADSERAKRFRAQYAVASTDPDLLNCRRADAPDAPSRMLRIQYLGVWDTVGALGIPERIPLSALVNRRHRFHDCDLSRSVEWARHALAIDETRMAFEPSPWSEESVNRINAIHREIRVEQDWFPGDHGSVGGGGECRDLSGAPLLWIAQGAERAGLKLEDRHGYLAAAAQNDPVNGPLRNSRRTNWLMNLRGQGPRLTGIPMRTSDVSEGALRRMRENQTYLHDRDQHTQWRRTTLGQLVRALQL